MVLLLQGIGRSSKRMSREGGIAELCVAFRQHIKVGFIVFLVHPDYDVCYLDISGGHRQGC